MSLFDPRVLGAAPAGLRRERMTSSPRYRDGRFENTVPVRDPLRPELGLSGRARILRDFAFGGRSRLGGRPGDLSGEHGHPVRLEHVTCLVLVQIHGRPSSSLRG